MNNETGDPWSEQKFRQLLFYHKKKKYVGTRISSLSKKKKKKITRGAVFDNHTRFSSEIGSKTVFQ